MYGVMHSHAPSSQLLDFLGKIKEIPLHSKVAEGEPKSCLLPPTDPILTKY